MGATLAVEPVVSAAAAHIQTVLPCIIRVKATAIVAICKGSALTAATATISATVAAIAAYVIAEEQIAQKAAHIALIVTVAAIASVTSATHIRIS